MEGHLATQQAGCPVAWIATGRKCARSEAPEKTSVAPPLPREGLEEGGGTRGAENRQPWGVELRCHKLSGWFEGIAQLNWRGGLRAAVRKRERTAVAMGGNGPKKSFCAHRLIGSTP
jgi:hypothetical protein